MFLRTLPSGLIGGFGGRSSFELVGLLPRGPILTSAISIQGSLHTRKVSYNTTLVSIYSFYKLK